MGIIAAFKEIVADNRFWKDCARKAQTELLAAGKQIEKLQDDAINESARVIDMLDAAHSDAEKMMRERDSALAELGQVRAERDEARKIAGNAAHKLALEDAERDAAVKRAEALNEENARLKDSDKAAREILTKHLRRLWSWCTQEAAGPVEAGMVAEWVRSHLAQCLYAVKADFVMGEAAPVDPFGCLSDAERMEQLTKLREENVRLHAFTPTADSETWRKAYGQSQALLGRAVAEIRRALADGDVCCTSSCSEVGGHIEACAKGRMDAILADATATQAVDAWRAQQEERAELEAAAKDVRDVFSLGGPTWPGEGKVLRRLCVAIAKVDARRVGGQ